MFTVPTPVITDSSGIEGEKDPAEVPLQTAVMRSGDQWIISVTADRAWMNDPARVYPVFVDPTTNPSQDAVLTYRSDGYAPSSGPVQIGNSNGNGYWRSLMHYNYEQLFGKQVLAAEIRTGNVSSDSRQDVKNAFLYHAYQFGYESEGEHLAWGFGVGNTPASANGDALANRLAQWIRDGQSGAWLGLKGEEVPGDYSRKVFDDTSLYILWKDFPNAGAIYSPADNAQVQPLTPTLLVNNYSTGQPDYPGFPAAQLAFRFKVSSSTWDVHNDPNLLWDSGWIQQDHIDVPTTKLQPGTKYCWSYQVIDNYDNYWGSSTVRNGPTACFTTNDVPVTSLSTAVPGDRSIVTSTTPVLSVAVPTIPAGKSMSYWFRVVSGGDAKTGAVVSSGWRSGAGATSWTVPAGFLQDGVSYTWSVLTKDQYTESQLAWVGHFTVNQRITDPGPAPTDSAGPVTVNLANGNAGLAFTSPTVSTLGGPMGMSFSYNSLKAPNSGLKGEYFDAKSSPTQNPLQFDTRPVTMTRVDSSINFEWGGNSPSDATSGLTGADLIPKDFFLARWTGFITLPAGTYYVGASGDDGYRAWIGSTQILNTWADGVSTNWAQPFTVPSGGQTYPFKFEYFERQGGAAIRFLTKASASAADSTAIPVNPSWFSRTPAILPNGWGASGIIAGDSSTYTRAEITEGAVNLIDGFGVTHAYGKTSSGGYTPPAGESGIVALTYTGEVTFTASEGTVYVFNRDGTLASATAPTSLQKPSAPVVIYRSGSTLVDRVADPLSVVDPNAATKTYDRYVQYRYAGDSQCAVDTGYAAAPTGMLCRIEYPDGSATKLNYNSSGVLTRIVDPGNAIVQLQYDTKQRLTGVWNAFVNDWIAAAPTTRTANSLTGTTVSYDTSGRVSTVTLPAPDGATANLQPQKTYTYGAGVSYVDTAGLTVPAGTGSDSHAVKASFNSQLQTTSAVTAEGLTAQTEWNSKDEKLWSLDAQGVKSTTIYDSQDRPTDNYGPAPASCFGSDRKPVSGCAITPAHSTTRYDEGMKGLDVQWWDNGHLTGAPKAETLGFPGVTDGKAAKTWDTSAPISGFPVDQWAVRATGLITFPQTGLYQFNIFADDGVRLYIDDVLVVDSWIVRGDAKFVSDWKKFPATAGQQARIRIEYGDATGAAQMDLNWWEPGQSTWAVTPGQYLTPNYGLTTSNITDDAIPSGVTGLTAGQVSPMNTTISYGASPWLGLAASTTIDPAGLALTSQTTYESSGLYNRPTGTLSPADYGQTTTSNGTLNTYWPDNGTPSSAICGVPATQKQYGMLKTVRTAPTTAETGLGDLTTTYVYDVMGRPVGTKKTGDADWSCVTYDARGRTTQTTVMGVSGQTSRTITNGYTSPSGDPRTSWMQDDATTGSTTGGRITTTVDLLGRTVATTDVWGTVTTSNYNRLGQITSTTTTAGATTNTLSYTYSLDGRVEAVSDGGKLLADPSYSNGLLNAVSYPAASNAAAGNGTALQSVTRDAAGRSVSMTWQFPADPIMVGDSVVRSQSGRIIRDEISDAHADGYYTSLYAFDTAGRLTTANIPGHTLTYAYSSANTCGWAKAGANGNRTSMVDTPIGAGGLKYTQQYCYDRADRLLTEDETITGATATNTTQTRSEKDVGTGAITYDAHGNVTKLGDQTFTYDSSDRHIKTALADGTVITYTRDVTGNIVARTETKAAATIITTRYSGNLILDGANSVVQRILSLPGGATVSMAANGATTWSYPNLHGDNTWTANASGARTGFFTYDPFGQPVDPVTKVLGSPSADKAVPDQQTGDFDQGWVGSKGKNYEHAASAAIIEMGVRMYAAWLGRFLAQDPVSGANTSRYNYPNDPVDQFDLNGARPYDPVTDPNSSYFNKQMYEAEQIWEKAARTARHVQTVGKPFESQFTKPSPQNQEFQNRGARLPVLNTNNNNEPITYTEWDVDEYAGPPRTANRIILGSDGSIYLTVDHYETFIVIEDPYDIGYGSYIAPKPAELPAEELQQMRAPKEVDPR